MFWSGKRPTESDATTVTSESEFFCTSRAADSDSAIGRDPVTTMASPSSSSAGAACAMSDDGKIARNVALQTIACRENVRVCVERFCIY
jgi:hypothetical protein